MSIEYLEEDITLPFDQQAIMAGGEAAADFWRKFIRILQEEQIRPLVETTNLQLQIKQTDVIYFDLPDDTGVYPDGSWRMIKVNAGIELQEKQSGTWSKVARWES